MSEIICKTRRGVEMGTIESELDSVFDKRNIVEQIHLDLFKKMIR